MSNVITYGTFDLFHYGHLEMLRRAKALGSHLTVAVSTDAFTEKDKGKSCECPYAERTAIVAAIRYVDTVIPETCWEQKVSDIKTHNIDVFVIGDDWTGKFDELKRVCEVVYLPRTTDISTSGIKQSLFQGGRTITNTRA
ncbi:MAG: adenylyltransferase/cytidyltransferase family protein [Verrucomicrobia bacterium]|jgi:glycerol-3-phosphate cytidylyltransferase|nr:adenylyltransferase/cytidyltransferase family protein [Verrucomicrobiota bacterium]MBT7068454.1 adenylyltransferase/cytidyltransferase family protein [Verrucomicrobiota bacterium]MBT7699134.1 adenylyltransferase/cytidyltransferase family protein [Verrucomicrobiota bacterium]